LEGSKDATGWRTCSVLEEDEALAGEAQEPVDEDGLTSTTDGHEAAEARLAAERRRRADGSRRREELEEGKSDMIGFCRELRRRRACQGRG
jgi:hypothetical protein